MQFSARDRAGRMAAEAIARANVVHAAAGRVLDVPGAALLGAHGQVQAAELVIEADAALVEDAVPVEDVSLPRLPQAKGPEQRRRHGLAIPANRQDAAISLPLDAVLKAPILKREGGVAAKDIGLRDRLQRFGHR